VCRSAGVLASIKAVKCSFAGARSTSDKRSMSRLWSADVRADVLLGHVRQATVGVLRTENTHPFRYRQWLFAQTGTVSEFERVRERLIQSVPEFLRGGIRGETDAEVVFHVFLSFLHDAGLLGEALVEAPFVRNAIRSTLAVVDGMTAELGKEAAELNIMISNGELVVAMSQGERAYAVASHQRSARC
jgi:predicted glutamine amidotransferase